MLGVVEHHLDVAQEKVEWPHSSRDVQQSGSMRVAIKHATVDRIRIDSTCSSDLQAISFADHMNCIDDGKIPSLRPHTFCHLALAPCHSFSQMELLPKTSQLSKTADVCAMFGVSDSTI